MKGADQPIAGQQVYMPAFSRGFSDVEVAAVSNYVIGHFGGVRGRVTAAQVHQDRSQY